MADVVVVPWLHRWQGRMNEKVEAGSLGQFQRKISRVERATDHDILSPAIKHIVDIGLICIDDISGVAWSSSGLRTERRR